MKNGTCGNCGADAGLHHYETMQCPKNGIEETRFDRMNNKFYPQQWEETTFIDAQQKKLEDAASELLENLIRIIDRIEESELQNNFPSAYKRAKAAIKKATE